MTSASPFFTAKRDLATGTRAGSSDFRLANIQLPSYSICTIVHLSLHLHRSRFIAPHALDAMSTSDIALERLGPRSEPPSLHESPYASAPSPSIPQTPTGDSTPSTPPAERDEIEPPTSPVVTTDREVVPLAKADSGREAWLFLIAGTIIETTVWGLLNAVGVLEHYWAEERFPGHHDTVTVASALMNGLSYLGVGFFGP